MPQISVLMCTYREPAAYVAEAIASIRNQTWRDFEFVIIADDPENRAVIDLLERQAAADSRIRYWINDRNRGLPASLNIGLSHCAGSYIARMDADDISLPERLEKERTFLEKTEYDLISCNYILFSENGEEVPFIHPETHEACAERIRHLNGLCHPGWLGRREVFEKLGGYREIPACEDYDFTLRAVRAGFRIGNVQETLLRYRNNAGSISNTGNVRQYILATALARDFRRGRSTEMETVNAYLASDRFRRRVAGEARLRKKKAAWRQAAGPRKLGALLPVLADPWLYEDFILRH